MGGVIAKAQPEAIHLYDIVILTGDKVGAVASLSLILSKFQSSNTVDCGLKDCGLIWARPADRAFTASKALRSIPRASRALKLRLKIGDLRLKTCFCGQ